MGTVNYRTSKYITLSIEPYDIDDFAADKEIKESAKENGIDTSDENALYSFAQDVAQSYYENDELNAKYIINRYAMKDFNISIEPGYYEGLSINIEDNYECIFYDCKEKRETLKHVKKLRDCLVDLAGCGWVSTYPGWSTGYADYQQTLKDIDEAIEKVKDEIKKTPTYYQQYHERAKNCALIERK